MKSYTDFLIELAKDPKVAKDLLDKTFASVGELVEWFEKQVGVQLTSDEAQKLFDNQEDLKKAGKAGRTY